MNFSPTASGGAPPQRGSFPLDHNGACKDVMKEYMACMREERFKTSGCRAEIKAFLQCRMDKNLMLPDEFSNLGLGDVPSPGAPPEQPAAPSTLPPAPASA